MIVKNNSTARAWGVGQVILSPGATQTCEDRYYDDISANPDLSVTSGAPADGGKHHDTGPVMYDVNPETGNVEETAQGKCIPPTTLKKRRRNGFAVMGTMFPAGVSTAYTGTASMMLTAPGHFDAVALVAINYDTTAPLLIDSIAFAVSERSDTSQHIPIIGGVKYNALAGANDQLGFVPGTWSGVDNVSIPSATTTTDGVVVPNVLLSDFTPLSSIDRADDTAKFPLCLARAYFNNRTTTTFGFAAAGDGDALGDMMAPYEYRIRAQAVDGVSAPANMNSVAATQTARIFALAFRLRGSTECVLWCGDSVIQGIAANGDTNPNKPGNNWNGYAAKTMKALASKKKPVGYFNAAWSGMASKSYLARAKALIPVIKPSVAVMPVFTPNDGVGTVSQLSIEMARALDFIDVCEQNSVLPVLTVPIPYSGMNNASRLAFVQKIQSLRDVVVLDTNNPIYDATNSAQNYFTASSYYDGTHCNLSGHTAIASIVEERFRHFLGL